MKSIKSILKTIITIRFKITYDFGIAIFLGIISILASYLTNYFPSNTAFILLRDIVQVSIV